MCKLWIYFCARTHTLAQNKLNIDMHARKCVHTNTLTYAYAHTYAHVYSLGREQTGISSLPSHLAATSATKRLFSIFVFNHEHTFWQTTLMCFSPYTHSFSQFAYKNCMNMAYESEIGSSIFVQFRQHRRLPSWVVSVEGFLAHMFLPHPSKD